MNKVVHRITRWRAEGTLEEVAADETPWCGRRDNEAMVNRTEYAEYVTCPECLANTETVQPAANAGSLKQ